MKATDSGIEALIEQGQPLVHSLAAKIHRSVGGSTELQDLIGYGELGLAEAAKDFDPQQGCRFTTFAYYRIRGAIYDGLSKMSWTSRAQYHRLKYEQMANETLSADAGDSRDSNSGSGAAWFGNVTGKLAVAYFVSGGESKPGGIRDSTVEDLGMATASSIVALQEINRKLHELVDGLPEAERSLINRVYFEGSTMQKAAGELGISKSWASRLHARILDKLAQALRRLGASD